LVFKQDHSAVENFFEVGGGESASGRGPVRRRKPISVASSGKSNVDKREEFSWITTTKTVKREASTTP